MSTRSVLKAGHAQELPADSIVLRNRPAAAAVPAEPGVWISQLDLEALEERCLQRGRAEGEEQGRRLAQQAAQERAREEAMARLERELDERHERYAKELAAKWHGLAADFALQLQALRQQLEAEVTEWTFVAVTRLLGQRAADDVVTVVRRVLSESRLDAPLTVFLHAQDLSSLVACGNVEADPWPDGIRFAADPRVGVGGCLVESDVQTLDARLEVQLALLRERLDGLRRHRFSAGS